MNAAVFSDVLTSAHVEPVPFRLPEQLGASWELALASAPDLPARLAAGEELVLPGRAMAVLVRR